LILAVTISISSAAIASSKKPITLKAVTFVPTFIVQVEVYKVLFDRINERAKGELVIKLMGGPEVIGPFEQVEAVQKGVVDMCYVVGPFYEGIVPGVTVVANSYLGPQKEREIGYYDYMQKIHNEAGLFYLGPAQVFDRPTMFLSTTVPVRKLADLKGLKIAGQMVHPFFDDFGIESISIEDAEMFTAMERGVVKGNINPIDNIIGPGLHEVIKYILDEPWAPSSKVTVMNLKKWNSLPKHLQKLIMDTQIEMERDWRPMCNGFVAEYRQKLKDHGIVFTNFSEQERKIWDETIEQSWWEKIIKKTPERGAKLKKIMGR
jgi:TRAP-type C4-dicarboxylate transport system substrate-binding protein